MTSQVSEARSSPTPQASHWAARRPLQARSQLAIQLISNFSNKPEMNTWIWGVISYSLSVSETALHWLPSWGERLSEFFNKRKNQMSNKSYNGSLTARPVSPGHDGPHATVLRLEGSHNTAPGWEGSENANGGVAFEKSSDLTKEKGHLSGE